MNQNDVIKTLIEYLKNQNRISDLEQDILDTANEISKNPFDRKSAENKVKENNVNYPEVFRTISTLPTTTVLPFSQVSDDDVRYNLQCQLELLCEKRLGGNNNGKNEI